MVLVMRWSIRSGLNIECFWCHHRPQSSLVRAMVEKAACSGWGKVYFTGSTFADNPWNENTLFWDDLVTEVSQDIDITCADSAESQMRIMAVSYTHLTLPTKA